MKVAAAIAWKRAAPAMNPSAASAAASAKAVANLPATVAWKRNYARLAGRKMRKLMETKTSPASSPEQSLPSAAPPSQAPDANAAATVTGPLPHENGRQREQPAPRRVRRPAHPVLRFT